MMEECTFTLRLIPPEKLGSTRLCGVGQAGAQHGTGASAQTTEQDQILQGQAEVNIIVPMSCAGMSP